MQWGFGLANHVLDYSSGGSLEKTQLSNLSIVLKSNVFYLARHAFSTFSHRLKFTKKIIKIGQKYCRNI